MLFVNALQLSDNATVPVQFETLNGYVVDGSQIEYGFDDAVFRTEATIQYLSISPFKRIMSGLGGHSQGLQKRDTQAPPASTVGGTGNSANAGMMGMGNGAMGAMAVASIAPIAIGALATFSNPEADTDDKLFAGTSAGMMAVGTLMMFFGGPVLGSAFLVAGLALSFLSTTSPPPAADPQQMMSFTMSAIDQSLPRPAEMFAAIQDRIQTQIEDAIETHAAKVYLTNIQVLQEQIANSFNSYTNEHRPNDIEEKMETLVLQIQNGMTALRIPTTAGRQVDLTESELRIAVNYYPDLINTLILAIQEWYLVSSLLNRPRDAAKAEQYFNNMVRPSGQIFNGLVSQWEAKGLEMIQNSTVHYNRDNSATIRFKIPGGVTGEMLEAEEGLSHLDFNPVYFRETWTKHHNSLTKSAVVCNGENWDECRIWRKVNENGTTVCSHEMAYTKQIKKKNKMPGKGRTYFTPAAVLKTPIEGSCTPSKATLVLKENIANITATWTSIIQDYKQLGQQLSAMANMANVTHLDAHASAISVATSKALQTLVPQDEVFNGQLCSGNLYIPKGEGTKLCIISSPVPYACKSTYNNNEVYTLIPDIYRSEIFQQCPNALLPTTHIVTKTSILDTFGKNESQLTPEEQQQMNQALQNGRSMALSPESITVPNGVPIRTP